ncbi:hypothetical protein [Morganella morganii]|uniref:hypothetical protein n=1 Tax=Morganella morganii TaxID=582 RepID=UPI001BDB59ED|nr:hypothetical protein [Morganella morganii]MBT0306462.1 hypothetical protein [Morganella morganii subsp. morganii]MDI9764680.1 hypothetical protein [Morganella morganii]
MYKITYNLKTQSGQNTYEFTVDEVDENDEKTQLDLARKDSCKYHESGISSVQIISVIRAE